MFLMWLITLGIAMYAGINLKRRMDELRTKLAEQQERIDRLEAGAIKPAQPAPVAEVAGEPAPTPAPDAEKPRRIPYVIPAGPSTVSTSPSQKRDMELDFGRNWLSKIGIGVLALGMAFLISYTFKYFGPILKIGFGYGVAGLMFWRGSRLERDLKLMNFGRALLGGGWAITYFTTYAMYHFEGARIITSQGLDLFLLALVVLGMMAHVLRHRSEEMMGVTLCVAYVTSTIGHITVYTIVSNLLLAVLILFLVYKFQWVRILSFGVAMTYAIHMIWVAPQVSNVNFMFLTAYWLVFFAGVHLVRPVADSFSARLLAGTNFGNIGLYTFMSYGLVRELFYAERFIILFAQGVLYLVMGWLMRQRQNRSMFVSDIAAGILTVTFSVLIELVPASALLLWVIEVPVLLFMGVYLKEKIFRYCAYGLSVLVLCVLAWIGGLGYMLDVRVLGFTWTWAGYMSLWAAVSMGLCFYLTQRLKGQEGAGKIDRAFDHVFSALTCGYACYWLLSLVKQPWVSFSLSAVGWVLLGLGSIPGWRRFRGYAYLALVSSGGVFVFDPIYSANTLMKWLLVISDVAMLAGVYHAVRSYKNGGEGVFTRNEEEIALWCGLAVLVMALHQYILTPWISLSLGLASAVLILTGFAFGNKTERLGGMGLLAMTLARVVLIDLSGLDIILKIITLMALGVVFLGVSYVYNRYSGRRD